MFSRNFFKLALATSVVLATTAVSFAATFDVTLKNNNDRRSITSMAVLVGDGEISGFEKIAPGETGVFQVILADGECNASLRGRIGTRYGDLANHNFCSGFNTFAFN